MQLFRALNRWTLGWSKLLLGSAFGVLPIVGGCCAHKTDLSDASVTVSTPVFTPIVAALSDDDRLSFHGLKDESGIKAELEQANLRIQNLRSAATAFQAGVDFGLRTASKSTDTTTTVTNGVSSTSGTANSKTSTTPPAVPPLPDLISAPGNLESGLTLTNGGFHLPADQISDLIAQVKMHRVHLEHYLNLDDFATLNSASPWIAYRLNFMVSVDPGRQSQNLDADALIDLELLADEKDEKSGDYFRIVTVLPGEAQQAIDELAAEYRSFALSLAASGGVPQGAANAAFKRATAALDRLEGLTSHTTFVVSYPRQNAVKIRFRPSVVPRKEGSDLQGRTRLFTAIVLVRTDLPNAGRAPEATPKWTLLPDKWSGMLAEKARQSTTKPNEPNEKGDKVKPPSAANQLRLFSRQYSKYQMGEPPADPNAAREAFVNASSKFRAKPATCYIRLVQRFQASPPPPTTNPSTLLAVVNPPPEKAAVELAIDQADGFYWKDAAGGEGGGTARGAISYSITGAADDPVTLTVFGTGKSPDPTQKMADGGRGVFSFDLGSPSGNRSLVLFLEASQPGERAVQHVELTPQAPGGAPASGPKISIKRGGVNMEPADATQVLDVLRALDWLRSPVPEDASK